MASVANLRLLVYNLTENLAGFIPLQQCIDTMVRLNTCGRCTAIRPHFCRNICEAIAHACYSPFNDALSGQLDQLWEVVREVVNATSDAISVLTANKELVNKTAVVS